METSRQLNAVKILLSRQTASCRYTLTDGFTTKTYNVFLFFPQQVLGTAILSKEQTSFNPSESGFAQVQLLFLLFV